MRKIKSFQLTKSLLLTVDCSMQFQLDAERLSESLERLSSTLDSKSMENKTNPEILLALEVRHRFLKICCDFCATSRSLNKHRKAMFSWLTQEGLTTSQRWYMENSTKNQHQTKPDNRLGIQSVTILNAQTSIPMKLGDSAGL